MKTLLALLLLLTSCASNEEKKSDEEKLGAPEQQIVGRIASVSKTGKFVLIQRYGPGTLPLNALYQSRGTDGRTASLRPSGERVRDFFAADLLNGTAEKGDVVMAYALPAKEEESEDEELETPDTEGANRESDPPRENSPDSENIKKQG
jgi:hypothetical protein